MKHYLLFLMLLLSPMVFCQTRTVDLGNLRESTVRYADITIHNYGEQTVHLVKIEHSPEIVYRVSQRFTKPDSTFVIRVQVNPSKTGKFDHVLRIYMSDNELPFEMRVIGNVEQIPDYNDGLSTKCPEFDQEITDKETEFTIVTVDAKTNEVLRGSVITILTEGSIDESWKTGMYGSIRRKMKPGFIYCVVSFPGYATTETGIFITPEIDNVSIPLVKLEKEPEKVPNEPLLASNPIEIPAADRNKTLEKQLAVNAEPADPDELDFADTSLFAPVNIVFVLDLSGSMKVGEKLNLMKFAMQELIRELRPSDNISIVSYSENARVDVRRTSGENKYELRNAVSDLKPAGQSSSTKGIKLGYKQFEESDVRSGAVNMVIVISDGAFNKYSTEYQKIVRKNLGLASFSVVAIQPHVSDEKHLKEASDFGNGAYIPIRKLSDAKSGLMREIRAATLRTQ